MGSSRIKLPKADGETSQWGRGRRHLAGRHASANFRRRGGYVMTKYAYQFAPQFTANNGPQPAPNKCPQRLHDVSTTT
jgi:hypothetical protein